MECVLIFIGLFIFFLILGYIKDFFRDAENTGSDSETRKLAKLYRAGKNYIDNLPTNPKERVKLETELKRIMNRLQQDKLKLQLKYNDATFFKGKSLNSMVEYDDAMLLINNTLFDLNSKKNEQSSIHNNSRMGSNSSNTANESDNVKKSNPQQQPNWNQPPNSSSANQSSNYQSQQQPNWQKPPGNYSSSSQQQSNPINKEDIINGFVNCGYSRSEAERIVRNYGTEEAFKKLCVEGIEVLKKSGNLSDGEAKRLMMDKGLLGALNESQKKLPPPSQS